MQAEGKKRLSIRKVECRGSERNTQQPKTLGLKKTQSKSSVFLQKEETLNTSPKMLFIYFYFFAKYVFFLSGI